MRQVPFIKPAIPKRLVKHQVVGRSMLQYGKRITRCWPQPSLLAMLGWLTLRTKRAHQDMGDMGLESWLAYCPTTCHQLSELQCLFWAEANRSEGDTSQEERVVPLVCAPSSTGWLTTWRIPCPATAYSGGMGCSCYHTCGGLWLKRPSCWHISVSLAGAPAMQGARMQNR